MTDFDIRSITQWEGDPALFMDGDGSHLIWRGGQCLMDSGLANAIKISLFTKPGWAGNYIIDDPRYQVGETDFLRLLEQGPLTPTVLLNATTEGEKALAWMITEGVVSDVRIQIDNVRFNDLLIRVLATRPDGSLVDLTFKKNGINWVYQAADPVYRRTSDGY